MKPPPIALRLAERGIPTFSCQANKRPACPHGFKDATRDPAGVEYMWRRWPGPLVGVPTGPASGFDILDIDPRHGGDQWLMQHQEQLGVTRVHRTRSGGEHWFFASGHGVRNTESKIAPGVDTRGDGGYMIWWPSFGGSVACAAPIAPWPQWLLHILIKPAEPETERKPWSGATSNANVRRIVQRQLDRVAQAAPGQRHTTLRNTSLLIGGLLKGANEPGGDVAEGLLSAIKAAGGSDVRESNARATIEWGLSQGASRPIAPRSING
jgi:hypothetical protein